MSGKKVSLSELMGKTAAELGGAGALRLSQLPEILGDNMPDLPKNAVGRHRLIRSLQQRFGANWRSLPGVKGLVSEFDSSVKTEDTINRLREIKYRPGGK